MIIILYLAHYDKNTHLHVTVWVSFSSKVLVQVQIENINYIGSLQIDFFNTVVGPFDPTIYVSHTASNFDNKYNTNVSMLFLKAPPNKVNPSLTCNMPEKWPERYL